MRSNEPPSPVFIDASSFAQPKKSGIGHIAEETAVALSREILRRHQDRKIYLVVPIGKSRYAKAYVSENIKIKTILLPARLIRLLDAIRLLPPLDLFLGRGVYLFPNYRNWGLLFSKSLTYIHDLTFIRYKEFVEPKNLVYLQKNITRWVKRADAIITASKYTKAEIVEALEVSPERVFVIQHGVDNKKFYRYSQKAYLPILKSYGLTKDKYILHIGNIEPRKNIIGLVEAYKGLDDVVRRKHPLLLIGGGSWLDEREQKAISDAVRSGYNILRPSRYVEDDDLPALYSAASVLVMPSFYEGFGLPPLQAMACNTPTVVSDNSSLAELFKEASILVGTDVLSVKSGIESSLKTDSQEAIERGRNSRKIVDMYTWDAASVKLLDLIDEKV